MSNIREVAKAAGVSVATVSRALTHPEKVSEASLKKVTDAIKSIGYRPNLLARNFRSTRSYCIVVLVPDITNPFFSQVIKAIEDTAQQKGYAVLLGDTRDSPERELEYVNRVETRLADGIIQLRPQKLENCSEDVPVVYTCACEGIEGTCVRVDNREGAKTVVSHLISLGHKQIGLVTGVTNNPHHRERFEGYKDALEEAGIAFNKRFIYEGDFTLVAGQKAARKILKNDKRPSALFCMSDQMAMGAVQTFQSHGMQVPSDISVAGFDDIRFSQYWFPPLTTIAQPADLLGQKAVELLVEMIENKSQKHEDVVVPTTFVIRDSTSKL